MARPITEFTSKEAVIDCLKNFLEAASCAANAEFTVKINKNSVPTISYKINEYPIMFPPRGGDIK